MFFWWNKKKVRFLKFNLSKQFVLIQRCHCKAVSDTVHFPFHTWSISSCAFCSCNNPAMVNCEQSCEDMVRNYAKTGIGLHFFFMLKTSIK